MQEHQSHIHLILYAHSSLRSHRHHRNHNQNTNGCDNTSDLCSRNHAVLQNSHLHWCYHVNGNRSPTKCCAVVGSSCGWRCLWELRLHVADVSVDSCHPVGHQEKRKEERVQGHTDDPLAATKVRGPVLLFSCIAVHITLHSLISSEVNGIKYDSKTQSVDEIFNNYSKIQITCRKEKSLTSDVHTPTILLSL